jgi:hypothetical protein
MRSGFRYISSALVVLVAGATNLSFALTLGAELPAKLIVLGLSLATAFGTATGPHFVHQHCRNRNWAGALAALAWFACCLAWDGWSAYGFTARQHTLARDAAADAGRRRQDAAADVQRAEAEFARYADAPAAEVAKTQLDGLTAELDAVERTPGIAYKGVPCARPNDDELRELCARRAALITARASAQNITARSEAKDRAEYNLATARRALNHMPVAEPVDPRARILGDWAVEWLPVVLLTIGAALSFFAVPPSPAEGRTAPAPAEGPPVPDPALAPVSGQRRPRRKGVAGSARVEFAQRIAALLIQPRGGLFVDTEGWMRGSQRRLAAAAGYSTNTTRFNRDLHEAAAAGLVEVDTTGNGTGIRLKQPA